MKSEFRVSIRVDQDGQFKVKVDHNALNQSTSKFNGEKYYNAMVSHIEKSLNKAIQSLDLNQLLFNSSLKTSRVSFMPLGSESVSIGFDPSESNVEDFTAVMNTKRNEEE